MQTIRVFASDLMPSTERTITAEGFLVAPGRLARTGVQRYRARELRGEDGQSVFRDKRPDDIVNVYRPADEVLSKESVASFNNRPITLGHPDPQRYPRMVTADSWKELSVGHVTDCKAKDGFVEGMLHITDSKAVAVVASNHKSALSNGYDFELDMTPGMTGDGQAYDCIQRNVRGNHVAIVDVARGGPECRIADEQTEESIMKRTVTVDGVSYQLEEQDASLVEKLKVERDDLAGKLKTRTADHETAITKLITEHGVVVKDLQAKIITPEQIRAMVADRATVLADCARLCPDVKAQDMDTLAVRRAMLAQLGEKHANVKSVMDAALAGTALDKADEAAVASTYRVVLATMPNVVALDGDQVARAFAAPLSGEHAKKPGERTTAADAKEPEEFTPERNAARLIGREGK